MKIIFVNEKTIFKKFDKFTKNLIKKEIETKITTKNNKIKIDDYIVFFENKKTNNLLNQKKITIKKIIYLDYEKKFKENNYEKEIKNNGIMFTKKFKNEIIDYFFIDYHTEKNKMNKADYYLQVNEIVNKKFKEKR